MTSLHHPERLICYVLKCQIHSMVFLGGTTGSFLSQDLSSVGGTFLSQDVSSVGGAFLASQKKGLTKVQSVPGQHPRGQWKLSYKRAQAS